MSEYSAIYRDSYEFYKSKYHLLTQFNLFPGDRHFLGDRTNRICRFCRKTKPATTFRKKAHAIPESIGNKSLVSYYECDTCNEFFGRGIENDFGIWSKPSRALARICGGNGVPTIKKGGFGPGWRIEHGAAGLNISMYEHDPDQVVRIDEENKKIIFKVRRDPYTPIAVLKSFVRFGLTIMPEEEIPNFGETMNWIMDNDHSKPWLKKHTVIQTFRPGLMPNDLIQILMLRRRKDFHEIPYAFLMMTFGNEMFQIHIPTKSRDQSIRGKNMNLPIFPPPKGPDPLKYGNPKIIPLDLTGTTKKTNDFHEVHFSFERMETSFPFNHKDLIAW